ncbi:hypothetical protein IGB42_02255 [Andreprevotia sp. IGB-42]|uniref:hypothetical protein n=1 Tax=Andreprevotia sp. IGB-42 TaxID=2497473 RepID=UPI00157F4F12|nr:hypothetical protein [Andreprevotia sp. IGB-42]KAF0813326.1 hypothetical protein IGB42_02255 [Andreprevotia sp. IGB-42]
MMLKTTMLSVLAVAVMTMGVSLEAQAGPHVRGGAKQSVSKPAARAERPAARPNVSGGNKVNAGNKVGNKTNVNNSHNNVNIDNSRDVNVNVDNDGRHGGYYHDDYHPIATAAAVTATVAVTAAVVGAIVTPNQLPTNCVQVMRANVAYMQCGTTWYQPQYQGSDVTYIVVNAP